MAMLVVGRYAHPITSLFNPQKLKQLHGVEPFFRSRQLCSCPRIFQHFIKPKDHYHAHQNPPSLIYSQSSYSSTISFSVFKYVSYNKFFAKVLQVFLATRRNQHSLLEFAVLKTQNDVCEPRSFSSCNVVSYFVVHRRTTFKSLILFQQFHLNI